jgi:RNA polymerase sigma factor (sigma-70 family)
VEGADDTPAERIEAERRFVEEFPTIERAIRIACVRAGLRGADADDFGSWVSLKLIEKDYAIIRKYEGRSTFAAFIATVVHRLLLDYRIGQWGKWHASAEAKRAGEIGITIEAMLCRDGRSLDEIMPLLARRWPEVTRAEVETIASRLPARLPRPRMVALDPVSQSPRAFESGMSVERDVAARRLAAVVRGALNRLDHRDRLILRLHFGCSMTIAQVSRALGVEQKPLYRQLQRALTVVRKHLAGAGIGVNDVRDVFAVRGAALDFGFEADGTGDESDRSEEAE